MQRTNRAAARRLPLWILGGTLAAFLLRRALIAVAVQLGAAALLMLISAMMGRENALATYETAVQERYRFFSFGDAMLITGKKEEA